jgi:hypothetical protein
MAPADGTAGLKLPTESVRKRYERRAAAAKDNRQPLEPLYQQLSDNFAPMRYRKPGETRRDRHLQHARIYNSTPKIVARTLASGLHAGLSSASRPWFRLLTPDRDMVEFGPVKVWLGQVEETLRRIYARSNLYQALPSLYAEWGVFGTMAGILFEDPEYVLRLEPMTAGTYWLAENRYGRIDTCYRERSMTARQVWQEFDHDRVGQNVRNALRSGRLDQPFTVSHIITPGDFGEGAPFKSCYWMQNGDAPEQLLAERSFRSDPLMTARWDWADGDTYGSDSPGISALPAAKQLQKEEVNIARMNEVASNPPLQAPSSLAKTGLSTIPGEVTYVPDTNKSAIRSVYDIRFDDRGPRQAKVDLERELKQAFYYDLFLLLTNDERNQRATAEEIRALYDEKVTGLGPVIEQGNPMLAKIIDRSFAIGVERSLPIWRGSQDGDPLFPPPPPELQEMQLDVDFISPLAQAQRAGALGNIERFMSFVGNLAAVDPSVLHKADLDQAVDEYGSALYVPAGMVRDDQAVTAIRDAAQQQQNMQQMMAAAPALKQGADALKSAAGAVPEEGSVLQSIAKGVTGGPA